MEDGSQGNIHFEVVWQEEISKCSHSPIVFGGAFILNIMAGIDKTYTRSWEEYQSLVEWCKGKSFTLKNGDVIRPSRYIYEWDKECFDGEKSLPVWNTPTYLDIWLIRNCPLKFIQDRLKEQYGGGWSKEAFTDHNDEDMYHQILHYRSPYDVWRSKGSHKFSIEYKQNEKIKDDNLFWWVDVLTWGWWYNEKHNMWYHDDEALPIGCNHAHFRGNISKRKLARLIKRWDLPKGTQIRFTGDYKRYIQKEFIVTIR